MYMYVYENLCGAVEMLFVCKHGYLFVPFRGIVQTVN